MPKTTKPPMDHMVFHRPENQTLDAAAKLAIQAVSQAHDVYGAPGDHGYDSLEGHALRCLYDAAIHLSHMRKAQNNTAAELLAACERVLQLQISSAGDEAFAELRTAIAKAKGQPQ